MATRKKATTKKASTTTQTNEKDEMNKSDHIREFFKSNPKGTAVECQKALAEEGIEIGSGHAQQILNKNRGGGKIDVATIQLAAEFVVQYGDVEKAMEAIDQVGAFIDSCGNAKKAKSALEVYLTVSAAIS